LIAPQCPVRSRSLFRMPPILRFLTHKRTNIAVSNLQHRTRSATWATPPIPAPGVLLAFGQEFRRPSRSICSLHGTGSPEISFGPLLASNSQRTWQQCLACPLSTSPLKPLPKSRRRKTYVCWDLDRQVTHLQSAAVAP